MVNRRKLRDRTRVELNKGAVEAVAALRALLRSDDEKVRLEAARTLARAETKRRRTDKRRD